MTTPDKSTCPGCDQSGQLGHPCPELACKKRGYHYIPAQDWALAHKDPASQPDPMLGQFIGDFLLVRVLGQGGFGKVYLGLQAPLFRLKGAVKLIELDQASDPDLLPNVLEKFRGEAEALASMSHPNVVKLLKYGLVGQRPYLVMEFVEAGLTLSEEIHRRQLKGLAVDLDFIRTLITQLLHALEVAHSHNIIHRDIKPDNIMIQDVVGTPHFVRVLDFGLAKFVERSDTTRQAMGTPQYMAPEQLSLKNIGPWTDLYAVGVICYWLFTGQRPFPGEFPEDIIALKVNPKYDPLAPLKERGAPAPVLSFLQDAMAYKTKARIQDVSTFRARFDEAIDELKRMPPPAPALEVDEPVEVVSSMHILFSAPIESYSLAQEWSAEQQQPPSQQPAPALIAAPPAPNAESTDKPQEGGARSKLILPLSIGAAGIVGALIAVNLSSSTQNQNIKPEPDQGVAALALAKDMTSAKPAPSADMAPDLGPPSRSPAAINAAQQPVRLALSRALEARDSAQRLRITDLVTGKFHTCALASTGQVRCWGANFTGELGLGHSDPIGDDELPSSAPWLNLGQSAKALVAAGDRNAAHSCAILAQGDVRCWGANQFGQLGLGHTRNIGQTDTPQTANTLELKGRATAMAAGASQYSAHTCALLEGGKLQCWGYNRYGQLGLGHSQIIGDDETPASAGYVPLNQTIKQVVAGKYHTCALTQRGQIYCWGFNDKGQLGLGHTNNIGDDEPIAKAAKVNIKGQPVAITAGRQHTCALLKDGHVRCWGWNNKGQLGYGDTKDRGDDEGVDKLPSVDLGQGAVAITAGDMHTCALLADNTARCWGSNQFGQLGMGHKRDIGDDESPASQGTVMLGQPVVALNAGSYQTCAILANDDVRCWGLNSFGQLGLGHKQDIGDDETPASISPLSILGAAPTTPTPPAREL